MKSPPPDVVEINYYPSCNTFQNEYIVSFNKQKEWDIQSIQDKTQYSIEIWVARIMAHNLSLQNKSESDILNEYFKKNHDVRSQNYRISDTAFMINAIGPGYNDQGMDYSKIFTEIIKEEDATKSEYLSYLQKPEGSKLIYMTAHSTPKGHEFYDSFLDISEFYDTKKNSVFYLLNAFSSCRWDEFISTPDNPNYMGGLYVFDKTHPDGDFGLGAIGFTGVGGFNNLGFFTEYYNNNADSDYGNMFKYWFNKNLEILFMPHNYVFLGDPTISPDTGGKKGDIDSNGNVELADAMRALKIIAGMNVSGINLNADVNGDGKIGMQEVIHILERVAEIK